MRKNGRKFAFMSYFNFAHVLFSITASTLACSSSYHFSLKEIFLMKNQLAAKFSTDLQIWKKYINGSRMARFCSMIINFISYLYFIYFLELTEKGRLKGMLFYFFLFLEVLLPMLFRFSANISTLGEWLKALCKIGLIQKRV